MDIEKVNKFPSKNEVISLDDFILDLEKSDGRIYKSKSGLERFIKENRDSDELTLRTRVGMKKIFKKYGFVVIDNYTREYYTNQHRYFFYSRFILIKGIALYIINRFTFHFWLDY